MARPAARRASPRPPAVVWALTAAFALALVAWSYLTPPGQSPDEPAHVDLVLHIAGGGAYPEFDERSPSAAVITLWGAYAPGVAVDGQPWLTAAGAAPRAERPTFEQWGGDRPTASRNQMPQHPPPYYVGAATVLRAVRVVDPAAEAPLDREWVVLRLLGVALLVPLPLLVWATATRLRLGHHAAVAGAAVPLAVPQLTHIGASVNSDGLLVVVCAVLALLLARVVTGDLGRWTAVGVGVVAGLALLVKVLAVVVLPWIALCYVVAWRREPGRSREAASAAGISTVVAVVLGGWWPLRNVLRHGEPFPSSLHGEFGREVAGVDIEPVGYLREYVPTFVHRFWGVLGWVDVPLSVPVVVLATVVVGGATVAAFLLRPGPREGGRRGLAAVGALVPLLAAALLAYDALLYSRSGLHAFMQGRYLFAAIAPLCVVVGAGIGRVARRWSIVVVVALAVVMQWDAVRVALARWWSEPDASVVRSLRAVVAWSPWPQPATVAVAVAGATIAVALAVLVARDVLGGDRPGQVRGAGGLSPTRPGT